jgi:hypothetical protein
MTRFRHWPWLATLTLCATGLLAGCEVDVDDNTPAPVVEGERDGLDVDVDVNDKP